MVDDATLLQNLVTEERVNHVIEKINYYGFSGQQLTGLIFASSKKEAEQLSRLFNRKAYKTVALTGDNSKEERTKQINYLENGLLEDIITVDIFKEGIDIPSINQIVILRQTQSSSIFIQQLVRGLRKHASMDILTV